VRDVQALQREEMLESRRRLQEQYDIQVQQAAEAKKQVRTDTLLQRIVEGIRMQDFLF
jgi:hypothetical protein